MYFDPANTKSYPGSGTTISDLSGNGVIGTIGGSPPFTTTARGEFNFDGINDKSIVTNLTTNYSQYTMAAWVKVNVGGTSGAVISKNSYFAITTNDWPVWFSASSSSIYSTVNDGTAFSITPPTNGATVNPSITMGGVWRYAVITYNASQLIAYIDGQPIASSPTAVVPPSNTNAWTIGRPAVEVGGGIGGERFEGAIAQIMMYNRALSSIEVMSNFNATRGRYGV